MTTLYRRATPQQRRVLRIVEGAVRNAAHAHGLTLPPRFARSVAKRAAGTLTAQWPDALAPRHLPVMEVSVVAGGGHLVSVPAQSVGDQLLSRPGSGEHLAPQGAPPPRSQE